MLEKSLKNGKRNMEYSIKLADQFLEEFEEICDYISNKLKNIDNIKIKPLDTSDIGSNAWLAGMTDADGNFSINLINSKIVLIKQCLIIVYN